MMKNIFWAITLLVASIIMVGCATKESSSRAIFAQPSSPVKHANQTTATSYPAKQNPPLICVDGCHYDSDDKSLCYVDVESIDAGGFRNTERMDCAPSCCAAAAANDKDGDGIPDDLDQCPMQPEDFDGFQDKDGCPDTDNDNDKILDIDDNCPLDPETYNGYQDDDGCPDTPPADFNQEAQTTSTKSANIEDPNLLLRQIAANLA